MEKNSLHKVPAQGKGHDPQEVIIFYLNKPDMEEGIVWVPNEA